MPSAKTPHRTLYLFLILAIFGLWRLWQRRDTPTTEAPFEPWSEGGPIRASALGGTAPDTEDVAEHLYALKWIDRSHEEDVPREKRDLTFEAAVKEAGWIVRHMRRSGTRAPESRSPFAQLRVYLQCVCGRDVSDPTKPHTIPGDGHVCPQSPGLTHRSARARQRSAHALALSV